MKMKFIFFITLSILGVIFLGACSNTDDVMKIKNKNFAQVLFVQKVENDTSKEELTKKITDETKIKETLDLLDGLKVKKIKSNSVQNRMKSKDTYMFVFLKEKGMPVGKGKIPYAFYILNDGTIIFTHKDIDSLLETPLITTEAHKDILKKIKENLNISF
ncbi:hypothetical protein H5P36_25730 [Bacillus sp. APMAM]|nr:hypothetical protein [Bacillus sp. APMAM]RTZ53042.1 hypothetical protein EKO25_25575 [Bacillus sp. SAJ1]